ncbi:hypothetical protein B0T25DRAFT_355428 [Lasiosphaeria hispida]|uniref:Uncharacterized protein n=1 Tax=Lasiosphaeria hispida TaxID=260671 RepID=A0AAJ0H7P2_9PEZI|nr:hypothetical protein B0T25DRAFT_355428 [Lasiosphaeria hispida]
MLPPPYRQKQTTPNTGKRPARICPKPAIAHAHATLFDPCSRRFSRPCQNRQYCRTASHQRRGKKILPGPSHHPRRLPLPHLPHLDLSDLVWLKLADAECKMAPATRGIPKGQAMPAPRCHLFIIFRYVTPFSFIACSFSSLGRHRIFFLQVSLGSHLGLAKPACRRRHGLRPGRKLSSSPAEQAARNRHRRLSLTGLAGSVAGLNGAAPRPKRACGFPLRCDTSRDLSSPFGTGQLRQSI